MGQELMGKLSVILHMLVYSLLWGGIIGGIAVAVPFFIAGGFIYTLLFALDGIIQGLLSGTIAGLVISILTCTFFFPPHSVAEYKLLISSSFAFVSALCIFVLSYLQFLGPDRNGGHYGNPVWSLFVTVIMPGLLMGLLSIPVSQRLASWFIAQRLAV